MSASLVGSEMCIRDRPLLGGNGPASGPRVHMGTRGAGCRGHQSLPSSTCLLYTSDAADDM
eukprot:2422269-Alexandrium_andersonii.AAC.1